MFFWPVEGPACVETHATTLPLQPVGAWPRMVAANESWPTRAAADIPPVWSNSAGTVYGPIPLDWGVGAVFGPAMIGPADLDSTGLAADSYWVAFGGDG